ncbi:hypothetical protein CBS101457_000126 [Exobasidium rhododendri]|nr:hypothetical protein CBS101457_000126 [Exobasidium rhododendri]
MDGHDSIHSDFQDYLDLIHVNSEPVQLDSPPRSYDGSHTSRLYTEHLQRQSDDRSGASRDHNRFPFAQHRLAAHTDTEDAATQNDGTLYLLGRLERQRSREDLIGTSRATSDEREVRGHARVRRNPHQQASPIQQQPSEVQEMGEASSSLVEPVVESPSHGEYRLQVDSRVPDVPGHVKVFELLSSLQKAFIVEQVCQIRPYSSESVRKAFSSKLKGSYWARELLSNDLDRIEAAVEHMWPIIRFKKGSDHMPWMTGLTNAERRQVIDLVAGDTNQATDVLRELFLKQKISPATSKRILQACKEERMSIIHEHGLVMSPKRVRKNHLKWKTGLSKIQRKALRQRMMNTGITEGNFYEIMRHPGIEDGFGTMMLRAEQPHFEQVLAELRNVKTVQ